MELLQEVALVVDLDFKYKILRLISIILTVILMSYLSPLFLIDQVSIDIKVIALILTAYGSSSLIYKAASLFLKNEHK
ncbi:hypothetical protein [Photobacterium phosphoreum]|uniref:hypothetical protein n=1 Tax=Photobacterium phosphoreum TaxID=659 RepID=UPI0011B230D6|nr:hypothetical protein [Photobacterium phosphoreum]